MPSLSYGENLFVMIAVLPLILYQVANIYGGNTVLEALPPENMCLTAYVGLLGISYLGLGNASGPAHSSYGSFIGVSILTIVAGWFQVPNHGVLMSKNTRTTALFHLALHLLVLAIVAQPTHKVGTAGIAGITSLLLSYTSPTHSLLDDVSSILGLMAGFMMFHYFEYRRLKNKTTNSDSNNTEPWEQRLATHAGYGALFAAFVYFMASDVVTIVKQPAAWYQGLVKIVSAICIVVLGFQTGGAMHSSESSDERDRKSKSNPFDKSTRTESLPLAATLLDLSGTPIAVTNAKMDIKIFSKAFRDVLDPRQERHDLKGTALDRAMNLSSVDSMRLQRCFDECKRNSSAILSDADSTFVLRNDTRVQVDVSLMAAGMDQPENRGFAVILKPVLPAGAVTSISTSSPQGNEGDPNGLPTAR